MKNTFGFKNTSTVIAALLLFATATPYAVRAEIAPTQLNFPSPPATTADRVAEMTVTLRDMLAANRLSPWLQERKMITPDMLVEAIAPQSAWGRDLVETYAQWWNSALDTLLSGLRRRNELTQALLPDGLRIPLDASFYEQAPEYQVISRFIPHVGAEADPCDTADGRSSCHFLLNLDLSVDGRIEIATLRLIGPDGNAILSAGTAHNLNTP